MIKKSLNICQSLFRISRVSPGYKSQERSTILKQLLGLSFWFQMFPTVSISNQLLSAHHTGCSRALLSPGTQITTRVTKSLFSSQIPLPALAAVLTEIRQQHGKREGDVRVRVNKKSLETPENFVYVYLYFCIDTRIL